MTELNEAYGMIVETILFDIRKFCNLLQKWSKKGLLKKMLQIHYRAL